MELGWEEESTGTTSQAGFPGEQILVQRLASRMFIRERSWEGRRDGQREKLSCVTVLRTAKPQSTLDPEGPLELS